LITAPIREFLSTNITSVWALDLLCLLRSSAPRKWSASELSTELRGSVPLVEEILGLFLRRGLVCECEPGRYRFDCKDARMDAIIADIAELYGKTPLAMIKEIIRSPNEKIHTFVDAFRLKKE
jgi:hypothetical protein